MIGIDLLFFVLMQVMPARPPAGLPTLTGAYYQSNEGRWIRLERAPMAETKTKGLETFIQTDGYTNMGVTTIYEGAHASAQLTVPKPILYIHGVGAPEDAMIIQLTVKKDTRTLHSSSGTVSVENKEGFKPGEVHKVSVLSYSDGSYSVTPNRDLKAGEYLLVFGYANTGFDFGIKTVKNP